MYFDIRALRTRGYRLGNSNRQKTMIRKLQRFIYRLKHSCLVNCYELWCSNTKESIAVKTKSARVVLRIKNRCHSSKL